MIYNKVTANTTTIVYIKANSTTINSNLHNLFIKYIALNLSNASITTDMLLKNTQVQQKINYENAY